MKLKKKRLYEVDRFKEITYMKLFRLQVRLEKLNESAEFKHYVRAYLNGEITESEFINIMINKFGYTRESARRFIENLRKRREYA